MTHFTLNAKSILRDLGTFPRKKFGQNFMKDSRTLSGIAEAIELRKNEVVLEIGPGLGFLTRFLLESGARVIAVEKDRQFAKFLQTHFSGKNLLVLEKDILKLNLSRDLEIEGPIKVAGNIPYNITSPILEWLIDQRNSVSEAVLTVQWEVALRLTADPGSKAWGALSIFLQFYSDVRLLKKIGKRQFYPPPKVDSALVRLDFLKQPRFPVKNENDFFKLVRRSFQKRRKTLLNSLADENSELFRKESLSKTLAAAGIEPGRRPETLALAEWAKLADMIY